MPPPPLTPGHALAVHVLAMPLRNVRPCAVYVAAAARPLRVEELDGHSVAGAPGEPCAVALRQTVPGAKLHGYDTIASALRALAAGKVDAYVGDLVTSQGALSRLGLRGRTRIGAQFAGEGATFRFLVRGDNTTLLHRLDSGLQGIDADTERRLRARWLQDLLPEPATAASETPVPVRRIPSPLYLVFTPKLAATT